MIVYIKDLKTDRIIQTCRNEAAAYSLASKIRKEAKIECYIEREEGGE